MQSVPSIASTLLNQQAYPPDMVITGFQPLTLIDYPGVISAIVFTQGCIFKCAYCHNPELVPHANPRAKIPVEDILLKLQRHRNMVEGVCITGGEPTIHHDLPNFIRLLKQQRFLVKLDTNGINPSMVRRLINEHLVDYLAMDLKHTWERYDEVARTGVARTTENCKETFHMIQQSGIPHEFRTTACPGMHTETDVIQIATQLRQGERYAIQPIRYGMTLDPGLNATSPLNIELITETLRAQRPDLELVVRT